MREAYDGRVISCSQRIIVAEQVAELIHNVHLTPRVRKDKEVAHIMLRLAFFVSRIAVLSHCGLERLLQASAAVLVACRPT